MAWPEWMDAEGPPALSPCSTRTRLATEAYGALTAAMVARQVENTPVSEWKPMDENETAQWRHNFLRVEQYMTTDVVTVREDEPVLLVARTVPPMALMNFLTRANPMPFASTEGSGTD